MCGSKVLMEQKSRGVVTSADLHPSQEIPAESPWRLGESLDVSRLAQPGSSRASAAAVAGRGELASLLGSPVLLPCRMSFSQQFCVPVGCWGVGIPEMGAEGCVLHSSSPSGCLQWEHWFCTHLLEPCRIHPLHWAQQAGCALGRQWGSRECSGTLG